MFLLIFLVMFSVKKGSIATYKSVWGAFLQEMTSLFYYNSRSDNNPPHVFTNYARYATLQFQFTAITSRSTSYFLFSF